MDLKEKRDNHTKRHPWELSRADSILSIIAKWPTHQSYADIGAGDCYVSERLVRDRNHSVVAVDTSFSQVEQLSKIKKIRESEEIPPNSIDVLLLMDVLEHVPDDIFFLKKNFPILKDSGKIVITVPAFQFLFSDHDRFLGHYRRYRKDQLTSVVVKAIGDEGEIVDCFYFYTSLWIVRLLQVFSSLCKKSASKTYSDVGLWPHDEQHILTKTIRFFLNVDFLINSTLGKWFNLPGLSLCLIYQKKRS